MKQARFVDRVIIFCQGGQGGQGSAAKQKVNRILVNSGGDGGRGGNLYIEADPNISDLSGFLRKKSFSAPNGQNGSSDNKTGKNADNIFLKVPVGTLIKDKTEKIIKDLDKPGALVLVVSGGEPGKGNYKRRDTIPPGKGQEKEIVLDFRLCADIVLIGPTNSGKSTLLSKITNLNPEISEFPFNTTIPIYGVVFKDYRKFTAVELPAVTGLKNQPPPGVDFLKHIYRAKVIVYFLDGQAQSLEEQSCQLEKVFAGRGVNTKGKYSLIVINKMDKIKKKLSDKYLYMQANKGKNIDIFIEEIFSILSR